MSTGTARDDRFRDVYGQLVPRLLGFIFSGTKDWDAAQDVLQEVMIRFWRSRFYTSGEVKTQEEVQRYVFRIASNLIKDRHKSRVRYAKTIAEFEEVHPARARVENPGISMDMEKAMRELSPRDQKLLWMAHGENYTHAEIAEEMGYQPLSIRVLLSRARSRLRDVIESLGGPYRY